MTDREKFEAWFRADEQAELRKSCAEGWGFVIWQAALASQQPADDGWIEWAGGDCPVNERDMVDLKFRDGDVLEGQDADWRWNHCSDFSESDIIAYRVVKP